MHARVETRIARIVLVLWPAKKALINPPSSPDDRQTMLATGLMCGIQRKEAATSLWRPNQSYKEVHSHTTN